MGRHRGETGELVQMLGRVAGEIADGDTAGLVILDVARSLVELLRLRDCGFEAAPLAPGTKPVLTRDGSMELRGVSWDPRAIGLPTGGFYLPVVARGRAQGRYVCTPRRRWRPPAERIAVAQALADQVASALLIDAVT